MAIRKNKDNPEEGTPEKRSRQDIRRERRQMRAMNIQRKEMGGEPLYSKQEIRDVKKPFEPVPSEEMKGFVNKEGGGDFSLGRFASTHGEKSHRYKEFKKFLEKELGPTYNESGEVTTPDVEYKLYEPGGMGVESKESKPVAITEEQKTNIIENAPNGQAISNAIKANSLNDNKKTFDNKQNDFKIANQTEEEIDNTNKGIDNEVKDKEKEIVGGDGRTMANKMDGAGEQYDWTLSEPPIEFTPTSEEDIYSQARLAKKKVPQLVIEKLGVQDYYPEIGRNIAVGTFTGSRIGSQTIYSGAGGLLPLGLYDARKRAIAAEIKRKEAIMDQIKEIPDIAKQFKTEYSQLYMDFLSPWLNAYKDNPEGLMSNTDFLRDMAHYKSVAENFLKVDSDLRNFKKLLEPKDGKPAAWATPAMLEIERKFLSGFLPGKTSEWLKGKKNISKLAETVQALPNGYNWIDNQIKVLLDKGQIERVIKPKEGEEVNWDDAKNEIDKIAQEVKDGSTDYESYLTVVKKYYDIDTKTLAEQWVKGNSLGAMTEKEQDDYINSLSLYAEAQIPAESMIAKIDRQTNDKSENYRAQLDYQADMARINAENWRFQQQMQQHNSATRAQIEAMEESGLTVTSLKASEVKVNPENTQNKEYLVWMHDAKGNWRQDYVPASVIQSENAKSISKGYKGMYFEDKGSTVFAVPKTGYFGVNENVITKTTNGYNGSQYGTMFKENPDKKGEFIPSEVRYRTGPTTIKYNGSYNAGAEQGYNTSMGQSPSWQAADRTGRGSKTTITQSESTYNKE